MSEVKLVIRDANEDRSGTVHGSVAEWFIAALSADPVSLTEMDAAVDRFALEFPARGHFPYFHHAVDAEPGLAGKIQRKTSNTAFATTPFATFMRTG